MLDPEALACHYSRFKVGERIMLTGHSHQAWPDVSLEAQQQAWLDAAEHADAKWANASAMAERVRSGFAELLEDEEGEYTLGANTHVLLMAWLSALPKRTCRRLVTTDGEFHTIRRQLRRLEEEGVQVVRVPAAPEQTIGQRLAAELDGDTAAVLVSAVFFQSARIAGGLGELAAAAEAADVPLLVDTYHALGAMRFPLRMLGLSHAYVLGGGYKYLQLGEGNCFLRYPKECDWRPAITGWFADFEGLEDMASSEVRYHSGSGQRFAGATYDPASHYRAAAVFDFFKSQGMTPQALRDLSQWQVGLLRDEFASLQLDPALISCDTSVPLQQLGGFLVLRTPHAAALQQLLRGVGVLSDYRGDALRLGPAPYVTEQQLREAMRVLPRLLQEL